MADQLSLSNRALLSVGARNYISSLNPSDGSAEANAVSTLWTPTFESLARSARWNCLGKQLTLGLVAAASGTPENPNGTTLPVPPTPWMYAYSYPSDCLDVRYIVPSFPAATGSQTPETTINNSAGSWLPSGGQIPFRVQTDSSNSTLLVILTNQSQAQVVYTVNQPNPAAWDSLFQQAFVASLGAYLVPALSLSMPLMQLCIQTAEKAITIARTADGNEGVTVMDHLPDWIAARAGGGSSWGGSFTTYGGYCYDMAWSSFGGSYD